MQAKAFQEKEKLSNTIGHLLRRSCIIAKISSMTKKSRANREKANATAKQLNIKLLPKINRMCVHV